MALSTVTSKGQTTIPKNVPATANLKAGLAFTSRCSMME